MTCTFILGKTMESNNMDIEEEKLANDSDPRRNQAVYRIMSLLLLCYRN